MPAENRVIVTVSDGSQTVTAEIAMSAKPITITVETPGTLSQLLADYDKTTITKLTIIGNLNYKDIATLNNLPNLAVLDMENANLEVLPAEAFKNNKSLTSVKLPKTLKTIGNYAFYNCSSLTSITIPDDVTSIGAWAFYMCSSLTSVTIGNSVTEIGFNAFWRCSSLTSVTIPDSVIVIGSGGFEDCSSLTSITVPASLTMIGGYAFNNCSGLTSFYCKAKTPPSLPQTNTFDGVNATLYVPIGCKAAYAAATGWKKFTTIIETQF